MARLSSPRLPRDRGAFVGENNRTQTIANRSALFLVSQLRGICPDNLHSNVRAETTGCC